MSGTGSLDGTFSGGYLSSGTLQSAVSASGNGTALPLAGAATCVMTITGTFTATVTFQGSEDGATWSSLLAAQLGAAGSPAATASTAGTYVLPVAGLQAVRAAVTWVSGTSVTVTAHASPSPFALPIAGYALEAGHLANLDTHTPALGNATMAASSPVTLASNQTRIPVDTNAVRVAGVLHRSAIAAVDKLATPVIPASVTDVTSGGNLAQGTAHYLAVSAGNAYGNTASGPIGTVTTAASGGSVHCIKGTIAQVSGAVYYDIFMSTSSTAPLWVGRMTETQRANANGVVVSAVGTVGAGSALGAGVVQVQLVGTGLAANVAPFLANNAYTPATPTLINCAGYSLAHLAVEVAVTDLRSLPTLTLLPFLLSQTDSAWCAGQIQPVSLLGAAGQPLQQDFYLSVDGATGLVVLVDTISGQGTTATVNVELV